MPELSEGQLLVLGAMAQLEAYYGPKIRSHRIDQTLLVLEAEGKIKAFWKGQLFRSIDAYLWHLSNKGYIEKQEAFTWCLTDKGQIIAKEVYEGLRAAS